MEKNLHTELFEMVPKPPMLSGAITAIYIFYRELDAKWNANSFATRNICD